MVNIKQKDQLRLTNAEVHTTLWIQQQFAHDISYRLWRQQRLHYSRTGRPPAGRRGEAEPVEQGVQMKIESYVMSAV